MAGADVAGFSTENIGRQREETATPQHAVQGYAFEDTCRCVTFGAF